MTAAASTLDVPAVGSPELARSLARAKRRR